MVLDHRDDFVQTKEAKSTFYSAGELITYCPSLSVSVPDRKERLSNIKSKVMGFRATERMENAAKSSNLMNFFLHLRHFNQLVVQQQASK